MLMTVGQLDSSEDRDGLDRATPHRMEQDCRPDHPVNQFDELPYLVLRFAAPDAHADEPPRTRRACQTEATVAVIA